MHQRNFLKQHVVTFFFQRALCVIEAMLDSELNGIRKLIKENCKDELLKLKNSSHSQAKSKTLKVSMIKYKKIILLSSL